MVPERGYHGVAAIEGEMYVAGGYNNPGSETLDTGKQFESTFSYETWRWGDILH